MPRKYLTWLLPVNGGVARVTLANKHTNKTIVIDRITLWDATFFEAMASTVDQKKRADLTEIWFKRTKQAVDLDKDSKYYQIMRDEFEKVLNKKVRADG